MVSVVNGIKDEYRDIAEITIVDCQTAEGSDFANRLKIQYLPTFVFVDSNGEIATTIIGTTTADVLRAELDALE